MDRKEAYNLNVDVVLTLMNKVKEFGYKMKFEEVAKMMDLDLNNLGLYNPMDLMLIASVNQTYANNDKAFEKVVKTYNNRVGAKI